MKKILFFLTVLVAFSSGSQIIFSQSNQRWIVWIDNPNYVATADDLADITNEIYYKKINPGVVYKLSSGVSFKIAHPKEYLEYVTAAVRSIRPDTKTIGDILKAIYSGEETLWGNDISYVVRNYYYSEKYKKVLFNGNYSGIGLNVSVLLIDGVPAFKLDCGNPLVVYTGDPKYTKTVIVPDSIKKKNGRVDTVFVAYQLENLETFQGHLTTICYWVGPYWSYDYYWWYRPCWTWEPVFSIPCFSYYSFPWRGYNPIYVCNSSYNYHHKRHNGYGNSNDYHKRNHFDSNNYAIIINNNHMVDRKSRNEILSDRRIGSERNTNLNRTDLVKNADKNSFNNQKSRSTPNNNNLRQNNGGNRNLKTLSLRNGNISVRKTTNNKNVVRGSNSNQTNYSQNRYSNNKMARGGNYSYRGGNRSSGNTYRSSNSGNVNRSSGNHSSGGGNRASTGGRIRRK